MHRHFQSNLNCASCQRIGDPDVSKHIVLTCLFLPLPQLLMEELLLASSFCSLIHRYGSHRWRPSFPLRGSLNRRQFDYVVASLSLEFATDLVLALPADDPYDKLKALLIKWTAASEQWCLQQLFNMEELDDCKPTQLLCWMQQIRHSSLMDLYSLNGFLPMSIWF